MGRKAPPFAPAAAAARKRKGPSFPTLAACKSQRLNPAPAQAITGWGSLPTDIALLVVCRLLRSDMVDYIAFRAVCSGWRACTPSPRDPTLRRRYLYPVDWVALCDGDAVRPDDACEITFFHRRTGRRIRIRLPELQRHRIVGFTDGLVILLHKRTTAVRVLHPFTRVFIDFPSLAPMFKQVINNRTAVIRMRAAVCSSASSMTSIAVVAWFPGSRPEPVVLCAEAGHSSWEVIHKNIELLNTLPFNGGLFGFSRLSRRIVQVYPPKSHGPVVAHVPDGFDDPFFCKYYLVESNGHILLVVQQHLNADGGTELWQRTAFAIFKVDIKPRRWALIPISNLGDQALFLSKDRCMSVSAKDLPSISSNSIYFSLPLPDGVILYSLGSRSFERPTTLCRVHDTKERLRPSVRPFTIADHLLTYCNHDEWSNGLMFHEYHGIPFSFVELREKIWKQNSEVRIQRIKMDP